MVDPTRIDLQGGVDLSLDARTRMIEGWTQQKNMHFRCPLVTHVTGNLWVGGCVNGMPVPDEIVHVVSLYPWESYRANEGVRSLLAVMMHDSLDQGFDQVEAIARWVNACLADAPTLVHCQCGLNRSNLIAVTALYLQGQHPANSIALLREKRSPAVLCNQAFEDWLLGRVPEVVE